MASTQVNTKVITNFSGELTSDIIGDMNSGLVPISAGPFGKLPFSNPFKKSGLQFIEGKYSLTGSTPTQVIVQAVKAQFQIGGDASAGVLGFDIIGNAYVAQVSDLATPTPDKDVMVGYAGNSGTRGFTLSYGGGIFYDGTAGTNNGTLVVGTDGNTQVLSGVTVIYDPGAWYLQNPFSATQSGSKPSPIGNISISGTGTTVALVLNVPRPMVKFLGTTYVANGHNIFALASNYQSAVPPVASDFSGVLNPPIDEDYVIRDLKLSNDGRYMIILATKGVLSVGTPYPLNMFEQAQQAIYQPLDSAIYYWNGTDDTYTSKQVFAGLNISAVISTISTAIMFAKDLDGMVIMDTSANELARITDLGNAVYPPSPHMIDVVGKYVIFYMQVGSNVNGYVFDITTNSIYPLFSEAHIHGSVLGALLIPTIHGSAIASNSWMDYTRAKLYYFLQDNFPNSATYQSSAIHLQNYGAEIVGNYPTQVEEFGRKVRPVEARVYLPPMTGTTAFTIQLYDANLNTLIAKTYVYAAGSDITLAQGSLTMVRFGLSMKAVSGFGFAIAPSFSLPFYPEKVEIDYIDVENPSTS